MSGDDMEAWVLKLGFLVISVYDLVGHCVFCQIVLYLGLLSHIALPFEVNKGLRGLLVNGFSWQ